MEIERYIRYISAISKQRNNIELEPNRKAQCDLEGTTVLKITPFSHFIEQFIITYHFTIADASKEYSDSMCCKKKTLLPER